MPLLRVTERLRSELQAALKGKPTPEQRSTLENYKHAEAIPFEVVQLLASVRRGGTSGPPWLHKLVSGSEIAFERKEPKTKDPELVKRLEKLQAKVEEREYQRLVSRQEIAFLMLTVCSVTVHERAEADRSENRAVMSSGGEGVQILTAMFTAFCVCWFLAKGLTSSVPIQLMAGLGGLIVALVLESMLYTMRSSRGIQYTAQASTEGVKATLPFRAQSRVQVAHSVSLERQNYTLTEYIFFC